ncbi:hypothetical protein [Kribbella kalugense]|uniref:hypothetical protein n=1 Tax=Kribbella kalugense TaxID=2512221 RepID=UPI001064A259|nr:hypothetical protein [Kribbella kalugense]
MRDRTVGIKLSLPLSLVLPEAGHPITERIQTRLPVMKVPIEPRTRVLIDIAGTLPRLNRQQLPPRGPAGLCRRHLSKHQPMVRLLLRIGLQISSDAVPQITLPRFVSQRMAPIRRPTREPLHFTKDLSADVVVRSARVSRCRRREPPEVHREPIADD